MELRGSWACSVFLGSYWDTWPRRDNREEQDWWGGELWINAGSGSDAAGENSKRGPPSPGVPGWVKMACPSTAALLGHWPAAEQLP